MGLVHIAYVIVKAGTLTDMLLGWRKHFRTPREFGFHAVWLYDERYFEVGDCQCTLHTGRPQGVINEEWIYDERRRSSNSHAAGERSQNGRTGGGDGGTEGDIEDASDDEHSPTVKPIIRWNCSKKWLLEATGGPTLNPQWRPPLLTAAVRNHQVARTLLSRHRPQELVWVSIDPLDPWRPGEQAIRWWPALIKPNDPGQLANTSKVQLLGVDTHHTVHQIPIRTWQSQPLPQDFLQRPLPHLGGSRMRPTDELNRFRPLPVSLDPLPNPFPRQYDLAILPYSIALRQAFILAGQYAPFELVQQADGSLGYKGLYYGPERIQLGDLVRLVPDRREFERLRIGRRWLQASDGASERSLFGFILHIGETEHRAGLRFSAKVFELQSVPRHSQQSGNGNLPDAPDGYRFREVTTSPAQDLPIRYIACRYDPNDEAVLRPSANGRTEPRRRSTTPPQGASGRVGEARNRRPRGIEVSEPDASATSGIPEMELIGSREQGIELARSGALRSFYPEN